MIRLIKGAISLSLLWLSACNMTSAEMRTGEAEAGTPAKKTHAELSIRQGGEWQGNVYKADEFSFQPVTSFTAPEQLTDHSYYLKYEGPGWENDLVAYRLYLDWRNGIDVFVKTGDAIVLPEVGQDGYDNYHTLRSWGGDALKVGKSVGLGALGRWHNGEVAHFRNVASTHWALLENAALKSRFEVNYNKWTVDNKSTDINTTYTIRAGDPSTIVDVSLSTPIDNLVTGLVKHDSVDFIEKESDNWKIIATYGKQNLLGDELDLGLAVFVRKSEVAEQIEGPNDYLFRFRPADKYQYGFFATWPGHPKLPQSLQEFEKLMQEKLDSLEAAQ